MQRTFSGPMLNIPASCWRRSCVACDADQEVSLPSFHSATAQEGKQLFDTSCITCHGRDGQGVEGRGPSLIGVGAASVEFQVGTGRMPMTRQEAQAEQKQPQFDKTQTKQLAQYVQAHWPHPTALRVAPALLEEALTAAFQASLTSEEGRPTRFRLLLTPACGLARSLEPAMVVIEDVDLIAQDRGHYESAPLLFELLNAMDGLDEDADLIFVLTPNRAESLEAALASRPGRIDLAVELPPPDAPARRRLFEIYGRGLALGVPDWEPIVAA